MKDSMPQPKTLQLEDDDMDVYSWLRTHEGIEEKSIAHFSWKDRLELVAWSTIGCMFGGTAVFMLISHFS